MSGKKGAAPDAEYLYKGIGTRAFERRFNLADYVTVSGARLENGLLTVELVRELSEAMKPRRIAIATGGATWSEPRALEHEQAA